MGDGRDDRRGTRAGGADRGSAPCQRVRHGAREGRARGGRGRRTGRGHGLRHLGARRDGHGGDPPRRLAGGRSRGLGAGQRPGLRARAGRPVARPGHRDQPRGRLGRDDRRARRGPGPRRPDGACDRVCGRARCRRGGHRAGDARARSQLVPHGGLRLACRGRDGGDGHPGRRHAQRRASADAARGRHRGRPRRRAGWRSAGRADGRGHRDRPAPLGGGVGRGPGHRPRAHAQGGGSGLGPLGDARPGDVPPRPPARDGPRDGAGPGAPRARRAGRALGTGTAGSRGRRRDRHRLCGHPRR